MFVHLAQSLITVFRLEHIERVQYNHFGDLEIKFGIEN